MRNESTPNADTEARAAELPAGYAHHAVRGVDALPARVLHGLGRLRQEVFVVEQHCVYLDFDGRDAEPETVQHWISTADGRVAATLRVLDESAREPGLRAIGRVATAPEHRGLGLAAALVRAAIAAHGDAPLVLEAQSHLVAWYRRFGFVVSGPEYLEDGIPHTPMRRTPGA